MVPIEKVVVSGFREWQRKEVRLELKQVAPKAERTLQMAASWKEDNLTEGVERGGEVEREVHVVQRAGSSKDECLEKYKKDEVAYSPRTEAENVDQMKHEKKLKGWGGRMRPQGQAKMLKETQRVENEENMKELNEKPRWKRSDHTVGYK